MKEKPLRYVFAIIISLSFIGSASANYPDFNLSDINPEINQKISSEDLIEIFEKYSTASLPSNYPVHNEINLPWLDTDGNILEWWISIEYDGKTYQKQVPVDITDFTEKFLKHPEYGEIINFNIDDDPEDDVQVIIGFYWSIVLKPDGTEVKSLEKRFRIIQLESGNYIEDNNSEFSVWSELHINYGLLKSKQKTKITDTPFFHKIIQYTQEYFKNRATSSILQSFFDKITKIFSQNHIENLVGDEDHIIVGSGYRSPFGEEIPRYTEKRFSFARDELFSPTIFQHQIDPGISKGKGELELLYGFKSYRNGLQNPQYDIEFSVTFNPAVYLKTKFIPAGGHVYYYFDDTSRQSSETKISFTSNILQGPSSDEGIELSLLFNKIDETLGSSGKWVSFDVDILGDHDLLGGKLSYRASDKFDIELIADSALFEEKIKLINIPDYVELEWDIDFPFIPSLPQINAHATGFIDLSMSSDFGGIQIFYPKTDPSDDDMIFIDVPGGIPQDSRIEAEVALNLNLNNIMDLGNYVYGKIKHTCSSNIDTISAYLPENEIPIVKVTEIPSYSEAKAKLYWSRLKGYAYAWRGSSGPPDPIEINVEYLDFKIHDILTVRDGFIDASFDISENGYFKFDTSDGIFGNQLQATNLINGDAISLNVDEVSANDFEADWDFDTSGEKIKINDIHFNGMVDTLHNVQLDLDYQGKTTSVTIDWLLRQTGNFYINVDQQQELHIDFSQFALNSTDFNFDGGITLSDVIQLDFNWKFHQGIKEGGNVDPGFFTVNEFSENGIIEDFDFYFTYQEKYGVNIDLENVQFYLDFEWWKGDRLLPYVWLDYEISADVFDIDLLWTNINGESTWYPSVEEW